MAGRRRGGGGHSSLGGPRHLASLLRTPHQSLAAAPPIRRRRTGARCPPATYAAGAAWLQGRGRYADGEETRDTTGGEGLAGNKNGGGGGYEARPGGGGLCSAALRHGVVVRVGGVGQRGGVRSHPLVPVLGSLRAVGVPGVEPHEGVEELVAEAGPLEEEGGDGRWRSGLVPHAMVAGRAGGHGVRVQLAQVRERVTCGAAHGSAAAGRRGGGRGARGEGSDAAEVGGENRGASAGAEPLAGGTQTKRRQPAAGGGRGRETALLAAAAGGGCRPGGPLAG
mmetsp:Transcript_18064/g.68226  ORF Transcript_18064/g.68226 Transcript_18064/m.68226 type:complete len:281 (-) Transcript_18064:712-1554(-)